MLSSRSGNWVLNFMRAVKQCVDFVSRFLLPTVQALSEEPGTEQPCILCYHRIFVSASLAELASVPHLSGSGHA